MPHVIQEFQLNTIIYWFRNDLRLRDNPAFSKACARADHIIPVYVHDETLSLVTSWGIARTSLHREHFLRTALSGLDAMLRQRGSRLIELRGNMTQALCALANSPSYSSGQCEIHCEEIAAPFEQKVVKQLRLAGLKVVETWQSSMLDFSDLPFDIDQLPDTFTHLRTKIEKHGLKARKAQTGVTKIPALPEHLRGTPSASIDIQALAVQANNYSYRGAACSFPYMEPNYYGSEQAATQHLENYFSSHLPHTYKETRDQLSGIDYSTKFSPWLSLGSLSAAMIVERLQEYERERGANKSTYWIWFELLWRDYFRLLHLKYGNKLYREQGISSQPSPIARSRTMGRCEGETFKKWCEGTTDVPLVDAAMHDLVTTGYLSNRLRQVVASYFIYDLNLDWRAGAAWFESQLVDYDVYSNQGNWLYIAGRGSDPRGGRRFNIQKQTRDHDPHGIYRTNWGAT